MPRSSRVGAIPLIHLVVGLAMTLLVIVWRPLEGDPSSLLPIAERMATGLMAYRDFPVEYPPLGLVHIYLPRVLSGPAPDSYQTLFSLLGILLAIGTAAAVFWLARRRWAAESPLNATLLFAGLALAGAPLVVWRFDILPAFLTALALVAYAARRPGWSGLALGFGTLAKIYPAFLVPVFAAAHLFERRVRPAALICLGAGIAVIVVLAGTFLAAGSGAFSFLAYQQDRGVEIESVKGAIALLSSVFGGPAAQVAFGFGAWQVKSAIIDTLALPEAVFEVVVIVALLAAGWISFARDVRTGGVVRPGTLVRYSLATLLAVILTNKVLSPQYLVWLLPFAALLPGRQSLLLLAIVALTTVLYPLTFQSLVTVQTPAVVALNVRNVMLIVFFVWVVLPRGSERSDIRDPAYNSRDDAEHQ
jgi:uncharacterized membrane protein